MKPLLQLFALELENMQVFKDKQEYLTEQKNGLSLVKAKAKAKNSKDLTWEEEIERLKEKWIDPMKPGDLEKFEKKYVELRNKEVKLLIFKKYL